jgi:hypothetical protein
VKNRFQSLPFKCNLQRYNVVVANPDLPCVWEQMIDHETFPEVGLCMLNQVDP